MRQLIARHAPLAVAGLCLASLAAPAPLSAQRVEFVTPFEYVMGNAAQSAGNAVGAAMASRADAARFTQAIASARAAYAGCKGSCTKERQTLGRLLARKDFVYLQFAQMRGQMGAMFGGEGASRADAMQYLMRGNSGYDGGIEQQCIGQFNAWASHYVSAYNRSGSAGNALGAMFGMGDPMQSLKQLGQAQVSADDALRQSMSSYEPYRACRDRAEMRKAGKG